MIGKEQSCRLILPVLPTSTDNSYVTGQINLEVSDSLLFLGHFPAFHLLVRYINLYIESDFLPEYLKYEMENFTGI